MIIVITIETLFTLFSEECNTSHPIYNTTSSNITALESHEGSAASGTATIYTYDNSCSFDKVIIIPEGIDPINDVDANYLFNMLNNGGLAYELMGYGYDIIILDYGDGADYIQRNGLLLVELINQINNDKVGNEELIIIGPSMGGIVAQYALTYMEYINLDHETRLFISFDSPHKGANISLGNQYWLKYFSVIGGFEDELNTYFNAPAVQQLVLYHESTSQGITIPQLPNPFVATVENRYLDVGGFGPHELFTELHVELADMGGYPQNLRKVAASNGNGYGIGQGFSPDDGIITWEYTGNLGTVNGNTKAVPNDSEGQVQIFRGLLDWNDIFPFNLNSVNERHEFNVFANNTLPFDNAPGSVGPMTQAIIDMVPQQIPIVLGPINLTIIIGNVIANNNETFIPTISALDINIKDPFYNIAADPNILDKTPFDAIYYPAIHNSSNFTDNQEHMLITEENKQWFLNEILSMSPSPPGPIITSLVADDPDDSDDVYSREDTITITFDSDTNTPGGTNVQRKPVIDDIFTFSESLGRAYSGKWTAPDTFTIIINSINNAGPPIISDTTVIPAGITPILSIDETSDPSSAISPVLSGDFGIP